MPALPLAPARALALVSLCAALACGGSSSGAGAEPTKAEPAKPEPAKAADGPIRDELRAKICAAEHVDETSEIFVARNKAGVVERVVVTPSRRIADMGNLVFDMDGTLLGHDTGSEFPRDDEALMAKERQRVAALMSGSMVANGEKPLSCK